MLRLRVRPSRLVKFHRAKIWAVLQSVVEGALQLVVEGALQLVADPVPP